MMTPTLRHSAPKRPGRVGASCRLEGLGRLAQPVLVQMAHGWLDDRFAFRPGQCEGLAGSPISLPPALGVDPCNFVGGSTAYAVLGCHGQTGEGSEHLREG